MATAPQQLREIAETERQLRLPLTTPERARQIAPPEVWRSLSPPQQQHLFRQMVQACRHLTARPTEVRDERP